MVIYFANMMVGNIESLYKEPRRKFGGNQLKTFFLALHTNGRISLFDQKSFFSSGDSKTDIPTKTSKFV